MFRAMDRAKMSPEDRSIYDERSECEIDGAAYDRNAGGLDPSLFCSCGFVAYGDTWSEAGSKMDDHLNGH